MMSDANGVQRAVLVTGSSTGIGRACALELDRLGFKVFAGVRKTEDGAALTAVAAGIHPLILDVTDSAAVSAAVVEVRNMVGEHGLYGLVNNAGIAVVGPLETLTIEDIRRQFEVNVIGQLAVTQAFLPLIRQAHGRVVIMGSIFGLLSIPFVGVYAASKFALEALADSMRVELAPWDIEVSLIEPGRMATSIWDKSFVTLDEWDTCDEGIRGLYRTSMARAKKKAVAFARTCASAEGVARVVARALTSKRPRTRYKVGRDVRFWAPIRRHAPDRLVDWVINLMLRMGA